MIVTTIHVAIAITSLIFATVAYFRPSKRRLQANYALIAATLVSGTVLVVVDQSHMIQACVSGLVYTVIATAAVAITRVKLARLRDQSAAPKQAA